MSKLITITSGKGGVGKTTTAINLGAALNAFGKDVVVLDANLTTPNVGLHLGAPLVPVSLNHVLSGKANIIELYLVEPHLGRFHRDIDIVIPDILLRRIYPG